MHARGAGGGGGGGGKGGGGRKGGASTKGTTKGSSSREWAKTALKHTTVGGSQLCFDFQRYKRCAYGAACKMSHDNCGVCGESGHTAQDCPSGAPDP